MENQEHIYNNEAINREIRKYQQESLSLRSRVDEIVVENSRLSREVRDLLEKQSKLLRAPPEEEEKSQQQLDAAVQEKKFATEMWYRALEEIDMLQRALTCEDDRTTVKMMEQQMMKLKKEHSSVKHSLEKELRHHEDKLRKKMGEVEDSQEMIVQLKATVSELKEQLSERHNKIEQGNRLHQKMALKVKEIETEALTDRALVGSLEEQVSRLLKERERLERALTKAEREADSLERQEEEAARRVQDCINTVERALMEKDQALIREKQSAGEIHRLELALQQLLKEAGMRTRQEVEAVAHRCAQRIQRLQEQLTQASADKAELNLQIERIQKEKSNTELQLEKLKLSGEGSSRKPADGAPGQEIQADASTQVIKIQQERDEALITVRSLEKSLATEQTRHEQSLLEHVSARKTLEMRLRGLEVDLEAAETGRLQVQTELLEQKTLQRKIETEKHNLRRQYEGHISLMEQRWKVREQELEARIRTMETTHVTSSSELHKLLHAQQTLGNKWRSELQLVSSKFESTVKKMKEEQNELEERNKELARLLQDALDRGGYYYRRLQAAECSSTHDKGSHSAIT